MTMLDSAALDAEALRARHSFEGELALLGS